MIGLPINDILRGICFAGAIVSAALAIVWFAADLKSSNDALNEAADLGAADEPLSHEQPFIPGAQRDHG